MDTGTIITLVWLIAGVLLVASEVFVPGLVAVFLGLSAMVVAGVRWLGLVEGLGTSFAVWLVSSFVMVAVLRGAVKKLLPSGTTKESTNEELAAAGTVVEVLQPCDDEDMEGRIRFQGTTWPAKCLDGKIAAGEKAQIVFRDKEGLGWVIEPIAALDSGHEE